MMDKYDSTWRSTARQPDGSNSTEGGPALSTAWTDPTDPSEPSPTWKDYLGAYDDRVDGKYAMTDGKRFGCL